MDRGNARALHGFGKTIFVGQQPDSICHIPFSAHDKMPVGQLVLEDIMKPAIPGLAEEAEAVIEDRRNPVVQGKGKQIPDLSAISRTELPPGSAGMAVQGPRHLMPTMPAHPEPPGIDPDSPASPSGKPAPGSLKDGSVQAEGDREISGEKQTARHGLGSFSQQDRFGKNSDSSCGNRGHWAKLSDCIQVNTSSKSDKKIRTKLR